MSVIKVKPRINQHRGGMILKHIFITLTVHLQKSEASLGKAIGDILIVLVLEILDKESKNVTCCPNRIFHKLTSNDHKPRTSAPQGIRIP